MSVALKLIALIAATFLLACLLSPPLYWLGNTLPFEALHEMPFQRYFNRALMLSGILILWPAGKWLGVKWSELGLRKNPHKLSDLAVGLLVAFALLLAMGYIGSLIGVYRLQGEIRWDKMLKAPMTAATVSLVEEWLFRGVLLGLCLRVMRPLTAMLFVSALFSILHFLKPLEDGLVVGAVQWWTGFSMLPHLFHSFVEPVLVLSGFTTLFGIGMVLAITRVRTASLWMPIGIHAGLILGNRVFNIAFKQHKEVEPWLTWFYGERIEIGIAPLITVTVIGLVLVAWLRWRDGRDQGAKPAQAV